MKLSSSNMEIVNSPDGALESFQLPLVKDDEKGRKFYLSAEDYKKVKYGYKGEYYDKTSIREPIKPYIRIGRERIFLDENSLELYEEALRHLGKYMSEESQNIRVRNRSDKKVVKQKGPFDLLRLRRDVSDDRGNRCHYGFRYKDPNSDDQMYEECVLSQNWYSLGRTGLTAFREAAQAVLDKEKIPEGVPRMQDLVSEVSEKAKWIVWEKEH